ncbi:MAG: transglutaminase domain-containing protein [Gammaproteobacteria bacterium]|nr:MAG: transglutaminase domain-containing protein [Gammaproteobacteria bacterium]
MFAKIGHKYIALMVMAAVIVLTAALLIVSNNQETTQSQINEPGYTINKTVRYSFTIKNTENKLLKNPEFWAYAPVKQTAHQKVTNLKATHKYELMQDDLGNQIMHFRFPYLAPHASKVITVTAQLLMSQQPNTTQEKLEINQLYLGPEANIETDDQGIKQLAAKLKKPTSRETSKTINSWIENSLTYSGYIKDDRGAAYALNHKSGDCTEYAYLYTALARANQIPSRVIGGYVYKNNAILDPTDFHNWSEYYSHGKWHLVDPQGKKHEQNQQNYIAMRIISQKKDSKMGNSHRFITVGQGLKVKLNK